MAKEFKLCWQCGEKGILLDEDRCEECWDKLDEIAREENGKRI